MTTLKNKFPAFVGLDWADKKHDVCVQIGKDCERSFEVISHSPAAIDQWIEGLHQKVSGNISVM
ncbi:MAG: hypothetical protein ACI88A_003345 [Paraglaciecola sp.]|jgi:hypothetical protein